MGRLLVIAGEEGVSYFRPMIPSKTLQASLTYSTERGGGFRTAAAYIEIPHYWSAFVHDGRGPVAPVSKRVLVWFADPKDDPRTSGTTAYPVRMTDRRRLTKAQYLDGLERNRERRAAGQPPYMIVTTHSGPVVGTPFFSANANAFGDHLVPILGDAFRDFVRANWRPQRQVTAPAARVRMR